MPAIPSAIPATIPVAPGAQTQPTIPGADPYSLYDVAINDIGFEYATSADNPLIRETAPLTKDRVDQAVSAGENTLTGWWIKSQETFHGGAGQLLLEPSIPTPVTHARYEVSKNCDVFTAGKVNRLPDTTLVTGDSPTAMVGVSVSSVDAVAYVTGGSVKLIASVTGTPSTSTFATATGVVTVATNGKHVYAASLGTVWKLDPASPATAAVVVATFTATSNVTLGWVKSRLMLGADNLVYEVDVTATGTVLGSTQLRYTHPSASFQWRAFAAGPQAVLAAGDAGGVSTITSFTVQNVSGAPVLQVAGDIGEMPIGERILSLLGVQGSFLAIGTTKGIRVGSYDAYYGRLTFGPLHLGPLDPIIPCNAVATRDRFIYGAGKDYDEAGLLALDLGTQTDQSGRYAWSPHLISSTYKPTASATTVVVLPVSNRLVFGVPTYGIYLEGSSAGTAREAWVRTSRIRYSTAEPKLFKLGRVRGELANGEITVTGITAEEPALALGTSGFVLSDPNEFKLPSAKTEWLQLKLALSGTPTLTGYSVKALPGTRRQRYIQLVVSMYDSETTKSGQRVREPLQARVRLAALEELDASGDEVKLQEFTPSGVVSTVVVLEKVSYKQTGRPTRRSDLGGTINILCRTVDT